MRLSRLSKEIENTKQKERGFIINPYKFAAGVVGTKPSTTPPMSWPTVSNGNQSGSGSGGDWTSYYYSSAGYSGTYSPSSGRGAISLPNTDSRGAVFVGFSANTLSVSCWFRVAAFTSGRYQMCGKPATAGQAGCVGLDSAALTTHVGYYRSTAGSTAATKVTANTGITMAVDTWYHLAICVSSSSASNLARIWFNGTQILDSTDGNGSNVMSSGGGYCVGATGGALNGRVAGLCVWNNYVLTNDNVQYLYTRSPYAYYSGGWSPAT